MRLRPPRSLLLLLTLATLVLAPGAAGVLADDTPPVIVPSISGTLGSNGWHTSNVSISWSISDPESAWSIVAGCSAQNFPSETAGVAPFCEAESAGGRARITKTIRIDKTPPQASGANAARGPDANGWYNHPVAIGFGGTDALSGIDSCTSTTYGGPDTEAGAVSGTCRDVAGHQSAPVSVALKYDATAPQLGSPTADRKPDSAGWYNHAVKVVFPGSDATSGIDACDAPTYTGPDAAEATVSGGCRDKAGNTSSATVALRYDATAPVLRALKARAAGGAAVLTWQASADTAAVEVMRTPGVRGAKAARVYRGKARTFRDARVDVGRRYSYVLVGRDVAGNARRLVVSFRLPSGLLRPAPGARVRVAPMLAWRKVQGASYYNVQLYRGNRKILSLWPNRTSFRLPKTWSFEGRSYLLAAGRYRWYVWPGLGPRSKQRYGALLGSSTFVVR